MAEVTEDFEAFARAALGTSDPDRIAALKEAIVACVEEREAGGYEEKEDGMGGEGDMLAAMMGGG